jgi:F-type H+-transporting ATPase subunit delta
MQTVTRKDIARVVAGQLDAGIAAEKIAKGLASYLIEQRRSGELESIMRDVAALRHEQSDVMEANVTSAFPLTAAVKNELARLLPAKKVVMNEMIDKNVLGGVRIEAGSTLIDATIRRQLETIKQGVN